MRNILCLLLLVLTSFTSFAQIKGTIQDSQTKEPVPYVNIWVEGESIGTTADEKGNFSLPETDTSKSIIFSAVGYGNKILNTAKASGTLYLIPQAIEINEVVIESRKNSKETTIGSLKNAERNHFFGIWEGQPWMNANFYEYKPEYSATPYLKTVKLYASTEVKGASFNVRLYSIGENGEPGDFLYDENIICYPKKGSREHVIDLSKLNIRFPEDGVFIAIEWLIIDSNRYEQIVNVTDANDKIITRKRKDIRYTPSFAITSIDKDIIPWTYQNGKWSKKEKKENSPGSGGISMELILSN